MINSRIFQLVVFSARMINFRITANTRQISYFYSEQNVQLSRVTTDQIGKRQSFVSGREGNIAIFVIKNRKAFISLRTLLHISKLFII